MTASTRSAAIIRKTRETQIELHLDLDGNPQAAVALDSPLPFLNHMLEAFSRHGLFSLRLKASGDIEVDPHHLVEDIGLCLGEAFHKALGTRSGIVRYGSATLPMDETLVSAAIDFCGRPAFIWKVEGLDGRIVGSFDASLAHEFWAAFAARAQCNLHVVLHHGKNPHHILEAIFKACARASDMAVAIDPRLAGQVPSTKGTLSD